MTTNNNLLISLDELSAFLPQSDKVSIPKSMPTSNEELLSSPRYLRLAFDLINAYAEGKKDALAMYRPLPKAAPFHASQAYQRILSGSNQGGKTNAAEAEWAMIARGVDPHKKRAASDLRMGAVGKDSKHVGAVMWRKLYWPGAYDTIIDADTGLLRSTRPWAEDLSKLDPSDLARKSEWMPSPPMIPPSAIIPGGIVWESKGEGIPSMVTLKNGTEMLFRTSNGAPWQGIQLDVVHFDEEITDPRWLPESLARLQRRNGIFIWSATPQASTPQLLNLHKAFLAGDPDVAEFSLLTSDNPYFDPIAKERFRKSLLLLGDDEYAVRWLGHYAIMGRAAYPSYSLETMGVDLWDIPKDWMLVVSIDPGTQYAAFVILAVPPSADCIYIAYECELRNRDADAFAKALKEALAGRRPEAYVFDGRAGDQHSMGRADTVGDHYSKAMIENGVPPSVLTGHQFAYGNNQPASRELSAKNLMNTGKMKFFRERIPRLDKQIQNRFYQKDNPELRERRTVHDVCDAWEMGCSFFDGGIYHNSPPPSMDLVSRYDQRLHDSLKRKQRKSYSLR